MVSKIQRKGTKNGPHKPLKIKKNKEYNKMKKKRPNFNS